MFALLLPLACRAESPAAPFELVPVASIGEPTAIVAPPAGPDGLYVTEQAGRIWRFDPDRADPPTLVADLRDRVVSGGEMGLLGLAFAPDYPADPRVFVNYTYEADDQLRTRIAAYRVAPDGAAIDPRSEVEILSFEQPYQNHNSGALAVGPDGMLYIGVGDGGSGGDPQGHAQDLGDWLGSILRIDVRPTTANGAPYTVPPDNAFVARPGARPEIWAYGVRNPWGMHFDGASLWFADVGQNKWEEVNRGVPGGNYGWNALEGTHCYKKATCEQGGFILPIAEYGHDLGQSVTGGVVYRGPSVPAIDGEYVYADFASGRFWTVPPQGGAAVLVGDTDTNPSTFGVDRKGRLYVGDYQGRILRVGR